MHESLQKLQVQGTWGTQLQGSIRFRYHNMSNSDDTNSHNNSITIIAKVTIIINNNIDKVIMIEILWCKLLCSSADETVVVCNAFGTGFAHRLRYLFFLLFESAGKAWS